MAKTGICFSCFPRTEPPPEFVPAVVSVFEEYEEEISTVALGKGLTSDRVLGTLRSGLVELGFDVEAGKKKNQNSLPCS